MSRPHAIVLKGRRGALSPDETEAAQSAIRTLTAMARALHGVRPIRWDGPEDGSMAGRLECTGDVEVSVHLENGGLHVDVAVVPDAASNRDDGGAKGTVVDHRIGTKRFLHVDAARAYLSLRDLISGWRQECLAAGPMEQVDPEGTLDAARRRAQDIFAAATISTSEIDGEFLVRVLHPTPSTKAEVCGCQGDVEWILDERTGTVFEETLPHATRMDVDAGRPSVIRFEPLSWMPDWMDGRDPMRTLRALAGLDAGSPAGIVRTSQG